ncbi:MAG: iron-containing alcohol dehydrogenase [Candidatus Lokiarchaeota archaeon]|nr:iron-containing alcohol dehydrogenase [Candidatus Lokiarchaeota archaeon]
MALLPIKIPTIYYGRGSLKQLRNMRQERVLIVTDKIIRDLFSKKLDRYFKKKEIKYFDEIEPDPKDKTIIKGGDIAKEFKPDLIVGVGGGSVMDSAKCIYFLYECEDKTLYQCDPVSYHGLGKKSKLVLIPTTSGTGAEHTLAAVVTKAETGKKEVVASQELIPSTVILDPKLPLNMPPKLTASTGIDALVHAVEGIINKMSNDFSDALNMHAIRMLKEYLPQAVGEGSDDIKIREKVHNAASIAGIGFGNSNCGIAHSCGHALGAVHHVQHGYAVGMMLPYVLEFNKSTSEEKYKEILNAINIAVGNDPTKTIVNFVKDLLKKVNLPLTLKELDISEEDWKNKMDKLVEFAKTDIVAGFNPRSTSEEEFKKIFDYAWEGKSIDF